MNVSVGDDVDKGVDDDDNDDDEDEGVEEEDEGLRVCWIKREAVASVDSKLRIREK